MSKTWLITGTSTGFGKELALYIAKKSDTNLVATARNLKQLEYLNNYNHGQILKLQLDVTKPEQIKNVVQQTINKFSTIDVLDNNAGLGYFSTFEEAYEREVRYMFEVNFWGLVHMTQAVLPIMRKQKTGTIISISSIYGLLGNPSVSFYSATKFAVEGAMESLSQEIKNDNIKVMLIEPSGFRTDWAGRSSRKKVSKFKDYEKTNERISRMNNYSGHQAGDPKIAAKIVYNQVANHHEDLPSKLPLGHQSLNFSKQKFADLVTNFKKLKPLSYSADSPREKE